VRPPKYNIKKAPIIHKCPNNRTVLKH